MNRNHNSPRARKYPAAEAAMRGYIIIERLPPAQRGPKPPTSSWPDFLTVDYDAYLRDHPSYFGEETNTPPRARPARATPREIDMAWTWLRPCKFMWEEDDRKSWRIFCAYAKGLPIQKIADHHRVSRHYISERLDSLFWHIQIQVKGDEIYA